MAGKVQPLPNLLSQIDYFCPFEVHFMKFSTAFLLVIVFMSVASRTIAQNKLIGQDNAITTAVPFLAISPDARHSALGDAGVATSPDANSAYWNAAKLVFIDKQYGGSLSYTPWLGKIVNDMSISYLTGFYKINREQAVSFGIKYFDLGDINFKDMFGVSQGDFNPREFAFEGTYSRMLTEEFSIGGSARYIYSNLTGAFSGNDAKPGRSVAADIGLFYKHEMKKSTRNSTLAFGLSISNIGAKISYTNSSVREDFLPINLRLGSAFTTEVDPYNKFTFVLDFNKLMVPTPPADPDESLLGGMFGSFSDASAKEELSEIMISSGIEYWYNDTFAARLGYFYEDENKGNRKYLTVGVGFRKNNFGLDVAYIVPTNKRDHPLAETLRFTLLLQVGKTTEQEESVTD
jgi:hypothetical protein